MHGTATPIEDLAEMGVSYLGDGDWDLPEGAKIVHTGEDNWTLTTAEGEEFAVWSEE